MRGRGFTLMELLVTMLLLSIVAIGVSSFITYATRIYADSQSWSESASRYRFGVQRLSRELRDALPGSVDVSTDGSCISFRAIEGGGHFIEAPVHSSADDQISVFALDCCKGTDCDDCNFGQGIAILDGYALPSTLPTVKGYSCVAHPSDTKAEKTDVTCTLTLSDKLARGDFSVGKRVFIAGNVIRYCLSTDGNLTRTEDGGSSLMGEGFTNNLAGCNPNVRNNDQCPFIQLPPSQARNSVVKMQFWITEGGQSQRFAQEVQVENVP